MKNSYVIGGAAAFIVVVGGIILLKQSNNSTLTPTATENQTTVPAATENQTTAPVAQPLPTQAPQVQAPSVPPSQKKETPSQPATPRAQSFIVNGNDTSADVTTITIPAGTPVSISFRADAEDTYHGGLDFRSPVVNTGTIAPGGSKTVNFTAVNSFVFTPYWPASNIVKPYRIKIVVQ